jgi:eukaryotic-like serine/threonine-protein kinase
VAGDNERELSAQQVDKYEVLSLIGEGGMASVFAARLRAPGGASKQVALKLIHPHLSEEPAFVGLFLNEMRVAMALSHRNIVQTFDAGKGGESYYLVMELMDGGSLSRLLHARSRAAELLPLDIVLFIATEVCAALEYAHGFQPEGGGPRGVVHRDVSPSNILLSAQGDVKLADFGVAKAAGRLTSSYGGLVKGKLTYMAPEQARGQVEPASDLFALGAVLYGMVAGAPLRTRPSLAEVRRAAAEGALPSGCRPEVSRSLEQIIVQCLSREPAQRPRSAAELRQRLAEEQEWVRRRQSPGRDPHARLREFLDVGAGAAAASAGGQAQLVADAIRQAALAVPTQVGRSPGAAAAATTAGAPPPPAKARLRPSPSATQAGRARRQLGLVLVALGLMALAGVILWWVIRTPPATEALVLSGAEAVAADGAAAAAGAEARGTTHDAGPPSAAPDAAPASTGRTDEKVGQPRPRKRPNKRARRRRGAGRLDLNASPWAKVYLGRRYLGETPLQGVYLPAGRHRLRLVNPLKRLSTGVTVRIQAGRTTRRSVRLGPLVAP